MKLSTLALGCCAALALVGAPAHAKPIKTTFSPTYCSDHDPNPDGLSVTHMTYNGNNANDCYGVVGGNINSDQDLYDLGLKWDSTGFKMVGDAAPGSNGSTFYYEGLRFVLSVDPGTEGKWILTATDINGNDPLNLPSDLKFIAGLKASDRYALWYFDPALVTGEDDGTFKIVFVNNGGNNPDLSHFVLYTTETSIPEPATMALLGVGLTGLALRRRRPKAV